MACPAPARASILFWVSSMNFLRVSGSADLCGISLSIRQEKRILFSVPLSVLGLMSIFSRSSIILHTMDVCHRPDSKPYACGEWDSHTPMTIQWMSPSMGLWLGAVLSEIPSSPRSRSRTSRSRTVERGCSSCLAISLTFGPSLHFMAAATMSASLRASLRPDGSLCILCRSLVSTPGSRPSPFGMLVPCFARLPPPGFFGLAVAILRLRRSMEARRISPYRSLPVDPIRQLASDIRNIPQMFDPYRAADSGSRHMRSRRLSDPTCLYYAFCDGTATKMAWRCGSGMRVALHPNCPYSAS